MELESIVQPEYLVPYSPKGCTWLPTGNHHSLTAKPDSKMQIKFRSIPFSRITREVSESIDKYYKFSLGGTTDSGNYSNLSIDGFDELPMMLTEIKMKYLDYNVSTLFDPASPDMDVIDPDSSESDEDSEYDC